MHLRAYNRKLLQEGCTLDQLVGVVIPPSTRDPLVSKRELPRFGLNSGFSQAKQSTESETSQTTPTTRPSTQVSQDEDRFDAYEKAARRNFILSKDAGRYELVKSPLRESVVGTSSYPDVELTPELRQRKGVVQVYRSLRKFESRAASHSPYPSAPPRSPSSRRKRTPDHTLKQLARIHKALDQAYLESLPQAAHFVSSHSTFLRKSASPMFSRPAYTTKPRLRRTRMIGESKEQTLSGEEILTILNSYKEEQAANRLVESVHEDRSDHKTAPSETPFRTATVSRSKTPLPTCKTLELVGIEDKSSANVRLPRRMTDHSRQARFKLTQSDFGDLKIEVESRFMQIVQASLSPKFEGRRD